MLQPEEIRNWRKGYGLTQKELSSLLGWGEVSLSRYENGALQDEAHEKLLRLAMEPHNLLKLINDTPSALKDEKRERIISELKAVEAESFTLDRIFEEHLSTHPPSLFNGYQTFNMSKFTNAVLFLCKGDGQLKTKMNKLLFYADFKCFKEFTVSLTGTRYVHLPFGPVPDDYDILFAALRQRGEISIDEVQIGPYFGENMAARKDPDIAVFTASELRVLSEVKEFFEEFNSSEIKDFSHAESAYQKTSGGEIISYELASELRMSLITT
jgi:transcriptional regulator with XRE-family HTH domain